VCTASSFSAQDPVPAWTSHTGHCREPCPSSSGSSGTLLGDTEPEAWETQDVRGRKAEAEKAPRENTSQVIHDGG
jgi:hypothetical protein